MSAIEGIIETVQRLEKSILDRDEEISILKVANVQFQADIKLLQNVKDEDEKEKSMLQDMKDNAVKKYDRYRARTPEGLKILEDFFGQIYEKKFEEIFSLMAPVEAEIYNLFIALGDKKEKKSMKFRKKQDKEYIKFLKELLEK